MIFGKINPVASIVTNPTPFTQTTVTGSYMMAVADPYILGTDVVNFRVSYGNCTFNESGTVTKFTSIYNNRVSLSGSVVQNWGTDDVVMLNSIAANEGVTITEIAYGDGGQLFY